MARGPLHPENSSKTDILLPHANPVLDPVPCPRPARLQNPCQDCEVDEVISSVCVLRVCVMLV